MRAPHSTAPSTGVIHLELPTRKGTVLIYVYFAWQIISNQLGPTKTNVTVRDLKNWQQASPFWNWRHSMSETKCISGRQGYAQDSDTQSTGRKLVLLECWHQYTKLSSCFALWGNVTCVHSGCLTVPCWNTSYPYSLAGLTKLATILTNTNTFLTCWKIRAS